MDSINFISIFILYVNGSLNINVELFKGETMKKTGLLFVALLTFGLFAHSQGFGWQGRMAGTGDAYGLLEDESDFLIHPAAIAPGKDLNFYGTYRLTYDYVSQWDNKTSVPSQNYDYPYEAKGHEWKNEGQAGIALPLGTGRMGIFFEYLGTRAKYNGDENNYQNTTNDHEFKVESEADNFNLRAIYGKPLGDIKLGVEIQISYKDEENKNILDNSVQNYFRTARYLHLDADFFKYIMPVCSDYYESIGKLSIDGKLGTVKNTFTIKGGATLPFAVNNKYDYNNATTEVNATGDVKGWNTGLDYWVRFPLNKDVSLPFIISVYHKQIKRDGSGDSNSGFNFSYEHKSEDTNYTAGGGADFILKKDIRIAIGIYYNFLKSNQDMHIKEVDASDTWVYDYPEYPTKEESRITFKAMTEINFTSGLTFLSGLNVFYGRVKSNYISSCTNDGSHYSDSELFTKGHNWGINLSFGTIHKTGKTIIEPFINAGFCRYKVSGDGYYDAGFLLTGDTTGESEKTDWIIGGGLSVKY
jgi:hypothetical protein